MRGGGATRARFLLLVATLGLAGCSTPTNVLVVPRAAGEPVVLRQDLPRSSGSSDWSDWFAVYVDAASASPAADPVQGTYWVSEDRVTFRPDFPFAAGVRYRVDVAAELAAAEHIPGTRFSRHGREFVGRHFQLPEPAQLPPPKVERVFPTNNALPANLLRFYVYFSNPMQRAWQNRQVRLLGEDRREIENVFMEFKQELWSPDQKRLTVLLDPGRIKRGVSTNTRVGPALDVGGRYTLLIEGGWPDAQGQSIAEPFEKAFLVTPAIRSGLDPDRWILTAPRDGTQQALVLTFDRPLDHALLARMLTVRDERGRDVPGSAEVGQEETRWLFRPHSLWAVGSYTVIVQAALEDVAGNNLRGPLDRTVTDPANDRDLVRLQFHVREP